LIEFKYIRWRNFLSTGNYFTEIKLDDVPTTLIVGKNGHGKSTLTDAIAFALYGRPYRKITKPQLVNSINKKKCLVEVEFSIGRDNYLVRRGIKPNKFEIIQNDELINLSADVRDYQSILENTILRLNYKSFCQVVIQGSSGFVPFMQLTAQHRRSVVEDILDLQVFSVMNTLLKDRQSENANELKDIEHDLDLQAEVLRLTREHSATLKENVENQISRIHEEINDNTNRIDDLTSEIDSINFEISRLNDLITDSDNIVKKKKTLEKLQYQLNDKIKTIKCDVDFFKTHENCPTCTQKIEDVFRDTFIKTKENQKTEIDSGLADLESKLKDLIEREQQISKIQSEISSYNLDIYRHQNSITSLQRHSSKLISDIQMLQEQKNSYDTDKNSITELELKKANTEKRRDELLANREIYNNVAYILKDTGIKSRILKQYMPIINKLINKYLAAMEFFVEFQIDENFVETIKSRHRDDFSYESFSEGEKSRIDLAIVLTWRAIARMRNSASTNLLIMDEVFDGSLDTSGMDDLLKIIARELQDTNTYVISHKIDQISDKFDNVIVFVKSNNFSRIK
jgi:DNA repair exonuclease SbcCD ATPase subunit